MPVHGVGFTENLTVLNSFITRDFQVEVPTNPGATVAEGNLLFVHLQTTARVVWAWVFWADDDPPTFALDTIARELVYPNSPRVFVLPLIGTAVRTRVQRIPPEAGNRYYGDTTVRAVLSVR